MNIKVIASGSSGNCYLISDDKTSLLLDAGISFKQIQIGTNFNISNISGCFVTHRHIDHAKSIKDLNKRGMKFVGTIVIYSYLQAIGIINSHDKDCFLYKEEK